VRPTLIALGLTSLFGPACRASVSADAEVSGRVSGPDSEQAAPVVAPGPAPQAPSSPPEERPLLGARQNLALATEQATTQCNCLDVGLGSADSAAFRWQGEPPRVDPQTQLVLAIASAPKRCVGPGREHALGASYWGYRITGNDVVVLVEAHRRGRPQTTGAVIPKPVGDGQVWVAPASRKLPFGRGPGGKEPRCRLGNPAPIRAAPFSAEELGTAPEPAVPAQEPAGGETFEDWTP
jgi:hypothetical protein